jgi:hypothetical protein
VTNPRFEGNLAHIMCVLTATHTVSEAIVRYEDGAVYVAYEMACGCTGLRPVLDSDRDRLAVLTAEPDSEGGGEGEIAVIPEPLPLAA